MTKELKRFEKWWDAEDDIPNNGPYTPDTPIQFAWAGWQAALAQPEQKNCKDGSCDCCWKEPEQEPVAVRDAREWEKVDMREHAEGNLGIGTAPPPSRRKPLTDEEISEIAINNPPMVHEFARAIEAAHGIKE